MRVLVVEPKRRPKIREIDSSLKAMQDIAGGLIQTVYPFDEPVALICNDEGKMINLPMNRALRDEYGQMYDIVFGTFFLCGISEDHFTSLTDEQIQHFKEVFGVPELFVNFNGHLLVLPME